MSRVIGIRAPAKINLYLHITGKRDDGYHLLDSLTVFANDIADVITIAQSDRFSFSMSGPFAGKLSAEDENKNLAVRAAKLFCDVTGKVPAFSLHLEKNIPMGAGLGGGSSDAAATIKALEEFYGMDLPQRDAHLLKLGADVPVCYCAKTKRFEGIGEVLSDAPALPAFSMVIFWPEQHSSTKEVFTHRDAQFSARAAMPAAFQNVQALVSFLNTTHNDLSAAAKKLTPRIAEAEQFLTRQKGCLFARMSGSGSAVFGIFDGMDSARQATENAPHGWGQTALIGNE